MAKLKYDARRRRALNIVWDVSWDYHFDPDFVAYGENGVPDLYLNAVVGLTQKYYDVTLIHQMFQEMENSALVDTLRICSGWGWNTVPMPGKSLYGRC